MQTEHHGRRRHPAWQRAVTGVKALLATEAAWKLSVLLRRRGAVVLMYHRITDQADLFYGVDAGRFRSQMRWIRDRCTPIAPGELRQHASRANRGRPPVLVTFDDGYESFYRLACPALREFGVPAVNFLATSFIDEPRLTWWDYLYLASKRTSAGEIRLPWNGQPYDLSGDSARAAFLRACKTHLKSVPDDERERLMGPLSQLLAVEPSKLETARQFMTWAEIRETAGLVTFGGHSHTHPLLPKVSPDRLDAEVATCRSRIAECTGYAPDLFAYPGGAFDDAVAAAVRRHGFSTAFSTVEGVNGPDTDWLAVKRLGDPDDVPSLALMVLRGRSE